MKLQALSNRIYYLPADAATDRPVLGYIQGDNYSLAIDAGNSPNHVRLFYSELQQAGLPLPAYTAITHWHWDHTFGMHAVTGKTIAGHRTNQQLATVRTWQWNDAAMAERLTTGQDIEFCDQYIRREYPDRKDILVTTADIVFTGQLSLDLGGVHCELYEITAPHSADSVLVYIPAEKTVFIGDADCEDFYFNNGTYDTAKLQSLITLLETLDFTTYVLGHDEPQNKTEAITYLKSHL